MTDDDRLEELAQRLALPNADRALLRQALQHPSYVREIGAPSLDSNQRLEFLGDAVLDLILADRLFRNNSGFSEGTLTKLKSNLVREDALARRGRELGLGEFLLLGRGEEDTGGRGKGSLIADCLEALIAVAYLSGGLEVAREFVLARFGAALEAALAAGPADDPKTRLQEALQERTKHGPDYVTVPDTGPPHEPMFAAECRFRGVTLGRGHGRTKREAEKQAAADALGRLDEFDFDPPAHDAAPEPADPPDPGDDAPPPTGARS